MKLLDIINEESPDDQITDKDRKKIRAVFAAFGAGIIIQTANLPKIRYQLINHYMIKKSSENVQGLEQKRLSMVLVGKSFENVIIYIINEDGTETNVTPFSGMWNGLLWVVGRRVEALFKRYDIDVVLNLF
jgi:translation initiation factor 2 gamma subunit (eIF-2gamma)